MLVEAQVHKQGSSYHVTYGDDKDLFVEFYSRAIQLQHESEKEGRPVFKRVPYTKITFPGNRLKNYDKPTIMASENGRPSDLERFPKQWELFQKGMKQVVEGMPLEHWAPLNIADVAELKGLNIHTVEQLANLSDHSLTWLGARKFRDLAISWVKQAKDGAEVSRLNAENKQLRQDVEMMKTQIAELAKASSKESEAKTLKTNSKKGE